MDDDYDGDFLNKPAWQITVGEQLMLQAITTVMTIGVTVITYGLLNMIPQKKQGS